MSEPLLQSYNPPPPIGVVNPTSIITPVSGSHPAQP